MADLQAMLAEFASGLEGGGSPDPDDWLRRVDGEERQKLGELIDRYLMTAPRRAWDPVAYETSLAKVAVDRVFDSREEVAGSWPELLPRLRNQAKVKRSELVERLAGALEVGTGAPQLEKVGGYYHRMEHGRLPAAGVSRRVIDALAAIVGSSADAIRAAGAGAVGGSGPAAPAFARMASPDADFGKASGFSDADEAQHSPAEAAGTSQRDKIDELFTGG